MSVTNYIPSSVCGYKYNKLKKVVYLLTKDHIKDIKIDGGEAYIINVSGKAPMKVECQSVEFQETESLDERYKFTKTLRFTVGGYANISSLEGGCYAIIITTDGVPFMVNVDFPAKETFTYTLSEKQNQTEFTLSSQSNYPTLKVNMDIDSAYAFKCKPYAEYGIEGLQLIEKDYVTINDQTAVITTFGGRDFKTIEYLKKSCTFTENFDGDVVTDTITFDIGFDDYKPSWQYNLLEFMDNLYAAIITPKSDTNKFFVGFNLGLSPDYTIDTTTSTGDSNKVGITLTEKSVHGLISLYNAIVVEDTDTTWSYVDYVYDYDTYECIDNNIAMYLAMQELDSQSNPTGRYKVHEDWYDYYKDKFNVIGTFNDVVTFYTTKCSWFNACEFTGLPSLITFIGTVCKEFQIMSTCDWHFENMPSFLTFSVTAGTANTTYILRLCNTLATDVTVTDSFDVLYGNKQDTVGVQIITGDMKLQAYYNNQKRYQLPCNESSALTQSEVRAYEEATYQQMTEAIIGTCVERVDDNAFYGNTAMTNVTIPYGVKYIDPYAFYNNISLGNVEIPNSMITIDDYAFYRNSGMTSLDLGNGVKTIDSYAFENCRSLPSVVIPNSVTSMGSGVFEFNTSLTSVTIGNGISYIPNFTFEYCTSLPSVVIPDNITVINSNAFCADSALTSVRLSNNLTTIGNYAFEMCFALPSIELPNSLRTIENYAFRQCTSLSSVTIPSGVTYVGGSAFNTCSSLQWVRCEPMIPPTGGSYMFDDTNNCPIYVHCEALPAYQAANFWKNYIKRLKPMPEEAEDCNSIKLHEEYTDNTEFDLYCNGNSTLTQTEARLGGSYSTIKEAEVMDCVEIVGTNAFYDCDALTSVTLANSIKKIDDYAFYSCNNLPSITLPCADYPPAPPSRLPAGYTEIEYVQNTTTANSTYVFTDYYPNNNTKVVADVKCDDTGGNPRIFGSGNYQGLAYMVNIENVSPRKYYYKFGDTSSWLTTLESADTDRHIIDLSKNGLYIDSKLIATPPSSSFTCTYPITIFNSSGASITQSENFIGKFYSFKVYENNVLVRDYVPCFRNSDNKVGFYDIVGNNGFVTSVSGNLTGDTEPTVNGLIVGNYAFRYCTSFRHIVLPDCLVKVGTYAFANDTSLTGITWGSGLTYTSDYMFYNCSALSAVTIPSVINSIGGGSFNTCTALTGITIPNTVTNLGSVSFENCTSLRYANIGSGVSVIQNGTFRNDSSLTSVTMTNNVTEIQEQAFQSCTSLPSITLSNNLRTIGNAAFRYDSSLSGITIPESVTTMGNNIFYNCTSMQEIWCLPWTPPTLNSSNSFDGTNNCPIYVHCEVLADYQQAPQWKNVKSRLRGFGVCPKKVQHSYSDASIWDEFCDMDNYITSADTRTKPDKVYTDIVRTEIGECVQSISANTYRDCFSLTSVTMADSVVRIGSYAFRYDTSLPRIVFPNSVTSLGEGVCEYDSSLTSVTLSNSISTVPNYGFWQCINLPSVTLPNSVTTVGSFAFAGCSALTDVHLSSNLVTINNSGFEYNPSLQHIELPNSLKTIGSSAFRLCPSLTSCTIPSGVTSIQNYAFSGDTSLQWIVCEPLTPPTLGTDVFYSSGANANYPIYVHCSALGTYQKATNWKNIKHRLFPIEDPCEPKLHAEYEDGSVNNVYCDGNTNLPQSDVRNDAPSYQLLTVANMGDCVTSIGANAFQDCVLLESATMRNTVLSIGTSAFQNCSSMSGVTMSTNLQSIGQNAFYDCTSLSGVTLPNTLTSIGNNAFYHCANIQGRVVIPNSVTSMGSGVYSNCYHITSVVLPNTLASIPDNSFQACLALSAVTIPNTVKTIGKNAFAACIRLTDVTIPNSVTKIDNNAFEDCERLQRITIPASVTNIGSQAFYYCSGLTEIRMESQKPPVLSGESVFDYTNDCPIYVPCMAAYSIADGWSEYAGRMIEYGEGCQIAMQSHYSDNTNYSVFCFDIPSGVLTTTQTRAHTTSYTAMTNAVINSCVSSINANAFENCYSLTSVTIPSSVSSIGNYAFRYDRNLTGVTIPSSISSIGQYAYYGCSGATSININGSPTINQYAFYGCRNARSLNLGSVSTIGNYAFYGCSGLTTLTIPSSVTSIGNYAFEYCSGLTAIYCSGETAPTIGSYVFDNTNNCNIYIPCDSYSSYYNKWSGYRSRLRLAPDCPTGVTVDTNSQWSGSTDYGNLSSAATQYDFYESYSNYHVPNSTASMYLTTNNVSTLSFYVRNNAESTYDFVLVYLDGTQKYSGSGKQSATVWQNVTLTPGPGVHSIEIRYKKDSSVDTGTDKGYLALPKNI